MGTFNSTRTQNISITFDSNNKAVVLLVLLVAMENMEQHQ